MPVSDTKKVAIVMNVLNIMTKYLLFETNIRLVLLYQLFYVNTLIYFFRSTVFPMLHYFIMLKTIN
jgi:hypothetical protein